MKSLVQFINESKMTPSARNIQDYKDFVKSVNDNSKDIYKLKSQFCNHQIGDDETKNFVELDFGTVIGYAHQENGIWKPETKVRLFNDEEDEELGMVDMSKYNN